MSQQGSPESSSIDNLYEFQILRDGQTQTASVFPGKAHTGAPRYQTHNLAVRQSLMEIFDEFTTVISGELKSMRLEDWENHSRQRSQD